MNRFEQSLEVGRVAEGLIAQWLMARGSSVMPAYEIEQSSGKGPQLFMRDAELVAPDMLVFSHRGVQWVESKHKTVFTWHRNTKQWTTGVDLRHYGDYLRVAKQTKLPVWLLFFHRESRPSADDLRYGCPPECPTGLFGGELFDLVVSENHRSPHFDPTRTGIVGHGKSGMVYWSADQLKMLATKDEVFSVAQSGGMDAAA
jgi:hypothetical protein